MSELNREVMVAAAENYMTFLRSQDLEGIMALYADDATVEDPVGTDILKGSAAIREFYSKTTSMELQASLSGPVRVAGNEAAFPFEIVLPMEDGKMLMQIIDIFKFNDQGKVISMRAIWGPENCVPA